MKLFTGSLLFVVSLFVGSVHPHYEDPAFTKLSRTTIALVGKAEKEFMQKPLGLACQNFSHNPLWRHEPISLFVWSDDGTLYVDHLVPEEIWAKPRITEDFFGRPLIPAMLAHGDKGGWVTIRIFNSYRHIFVKTITKHGRKYIIGAGFFSEDRNFIAGLIMKSIDYRWSEATDLTPLFSLISNPVGPLVHGDLYAVVYDTSGICWAHGSNALMIGQNLFDTPLHDLYKELTDLATPQTQMLSSREQRSTAGKLRLQSYFKKFHDTLTGRNYVIVIHFFDGIREPDLAKTAATIMSSLANNEVTLDHISERKVPIHAVSIGALDVMITDEHGLFVAITSPLFANYLNRSFSDYLTDHGRNLFAIMKQQLAHTKKAYNFRNHRNALEMIYAQKIWINQKPYYLFISGYYPSNWAEITKLMVSSAAHFIRYEPEPHGLTTLTDFNSPYIKGNVQIALHDLQGNTWVNGFYRSLIWSRDRELIELPSGWITDARKPNVRKSIYRTLIPNPFSPSKGDFMVSAGYYIKTSQLRLDRSLP